MTSVEPEAHERRRAVRQEVLLITEVDTSMRPLAAITSELSTCGARLYTHEPLREGEAIDLGLMSAKPGCEMVRVFGRVLRVVQREAGFWRHEAAVEFSTAIRSIDDLTWLDPSERTDRD